MKRYEVQIFIEGGERYRCGHVHEGAHHTCAIACLKALKKAWGDDAAAVSFRATQTPGGESLLEVEAGSAPVRRLAEKARDIEAQHKAKGEKPPTVAKVIEDNPTPKGASAEQRLIDILRETLGGSRDVESLAVKAAEDAIEAAIKSGRIGATHFEVTVKKGEVQTIEGAAHVAFERALQLAQVRQHALLIGPAGCGKTYLVSQVAKALKLPCTLLSFSEGVSEGQVFGKRLPESDAGWSYQRSPFVQAYEEGGVVLLDEFDAADANVATSLNAALSGDICPVPNRLENPVAKRHENFVVFAATNTYGTGGNRQYTRNRLDEATLDRFRAGQLELGYDRKLETQLVPDEKLRERVWKVRDKVEEHKLQRVVSTRYLVDAYRQVRAGFWTVSDAVEGLVLGWRDDERKLAGV